MFTGIVDHCGRIMAIEQHETCRLTIESQFSDLTLGESIAIDGVCLTVIQYQSDNFTVELSPETLRLTTAQTYQRERMVNLERSLRLMDRLGGHFVTGHVDAISKVARISSHQEFIEIQFSVAPSARRYLVKKGSIAINGVSLTLNEVDDNSFTVMLIPHTLSRTNLASLVVGDHVNIEYDYLAKLVVNQVGEYA